ncbi:alpha/beta hydrolase [Aestuariivita boseongensis]|uniref:alpha/beta hydrolase n=1 Tax=Aestuariivita boseongensis TaxID=1470562 RepID=UPI0006822678|nr:alpha/beta hydrolase [Aestuariivita boseongensis]
MDYDSYLDEEVRAFIAQTNAHYPPDAVTMTVEDQRRVYDDLCRAFDRGYPDGVQASDTQAHGVPVRIYEAGEPTVTVVYFHGGGFVVGGLESHDSICAEICAGTGYRVVSVDYRLAPEHLHPAAFEDSLATTQWVLDQFEGRVVLVGDSAGGNLAACVAHKLRGQTDRISGQLLIYPALAPGRDHGSYATHAFAPGLAKADIDFYQGIRTGGPDASDDPTYMPMADTDFSGLPPTVIISAECDPLADDGGIYRDALQAAGTKAHWINEKGLIHGYLRARVMSEKARESFDRITADIQCLGQGVWPYE